MMRTDFPRISHGFPYVVLICFEYHRSSKIIKYHHVWIGRWYLSLDSLETIETMETQSNPSQMRYRLISVNQLYPSYWDFFHHRKIFMGSLPIVIRMYHQYGSSHYGSVSIVFHKLFCAIFTVVIIWLQYVAIITSLQMFTIFYNTYQIYQYMFYCSTVLPWFSVENIVSSVGVEASRRTVHDTGLEEETTATLSGESLQPERSERSERSRFRRISGWWMQEALEALEAWHCEVVNGTVIFVDYLGRSYPSSELPKSLRCPALFWILQWSTIVSTHLVQNTEICILQARLQDKPGRKKDLNMDRKHILQMTDMQFPSQLEAGGGWRKLAG
jgi:hypothetical protein